MMPHFWRSGMCGLLLTRMDVPVRVQSMGRIVILNNSIESFAKKKKKRQNKNKNTKRKKTTKKKNKKQHEIKQLKSQLNKNINMTAKPPDIE